MWGDGDGSVDVRHEVSVEGVNLADKSVTFECPGKGLVTEVCEA